MSTPRRGCPRPVVDIRARAWKLEKLEIRKCPRPVVLYKRLYYDGANMVCAFLTFLQLAIRWQNHLYKNIESTKKEWAGELWCAIADLDSQPLCLS